jgi:hypothetical protein
MGVAQRNAAENYLASIKGLVITCLKRLIRKKSKKSILTSFRRKPESRIKELVPGFRRDDAETPVFFALLRPQPSGSGPQFHQK